MEGYILQLPIHPFLLILACSEIKESCVLGAPYKLTKHIYQQYDTLPSFQRKKECSCRFIYLLKVILKLMQIDVWLERNNGNKTFASESFHFCNVSYTIESATHGI